MSRGCQKECSGNIMEDYEKDKIVMNIAILVIFITVILAILVYYGRI